MIITKSSLFSTDEIEKVKEKFDVYIKTVIDINKEICSAGCDRHFESEKVLLETGSKQTDLWGGGIDLETGKIDSKSFINIRPTDNNASNEIQDPKKRKQFEKLMKEFFKEVL